MAQLSMKETNFRLPNGRPHRVEWLGGTGKGAGVGVTGVTVWKSWEVGGREEGQLVSPYGKAGRWEAGGDWCYHMDWLGGGKGRG